MSIEALCTGDTVVLQTQAVTVGASGGVSESYTDGTAYDCNVQIEERGDPDGAFSDTRYGARGQRTLFKVYFSEDVELNPSMRLKHTVKGGVTLGTAKIMRVLDYYDEGRPGETMLWIADCEIVDTRLET